MLENEFWTRKDEMVEAINEKGYDVVELNDEHAVIENEEETLELILGHANSTMWIEKIHEI